METQYWWYSVWKKLMLRWIDLQIKNKMTAMKKNVLSNKQQINYSVVYFPLHYGAYCKYHWNRYITHTFIIKGLKYFRWNYFRIKTNKEENVVEAIAIKCNKFLRSTGLYLKDKTLQEMITKFVLNTIFKNMALSWIFYSNKQM